MVRKIFFIIFLCISFVMPALAGKTTLNETVLKETYGPRLNGVNIDIKYAFQRAKGKKWDQSSYNERKKFLAKWDERLKQEKSEEKKIKDAEDKVLKDKENAKKEKEKTAANALKEKEKVTKEAKKNHDRQRADLNRKTRDMQRNLSNLRRLNRNADR